MVAMGRRAGQAPLTRDRILEAALAMIDESGLDGLSMRRLGRALGVDPMAVYYHVSNKDELLRGVVELVFARLPQPDPDGDWADRVREWAGIYRDVALAHPNLVLRIVSEPTAVAIAAAHINESLYAALEASGLPPTDVVCAGDLIVDYINGTALAAAYVATDDPAAVEAFHAALASRPADEVAVQRRLLDQPATGRDSFTFGLDTILTGLDTHLSTPTRRPRGRRATNHERRPNGS
jgi:AcrR family transcriptional regulator